MPLIGRPHVAIFHAFVVVIVCGPVHSDVPKISYIGISIEAKYWSVSIDIGAAAVKNTFV